MFAIALTNVNLCSLVLKFDEVDKGNTLIFCHLQT